MENRIEVVSLTDEVKQEILDEIAGLRSKMPFLISLSAEEKKSLQQMDDGRKPFVEKAIELAGRNAAINPGIDLLEASKHDIDFYSALASIEKDLMQMVEMVSETKQLAGAEAYEFARFVYMKAKMAKKMDEPGMQTIVDALGKLYKQASAPLQTAIK